MVCIDKRVPGCTTHWPGGQPFAVNMLSADQEVLSRRFASSGPEQFDGVGYTESSLGTAWLDDSLAVVECRFVEKYAGGDHTIIVGQVEATRVREAKPLLYFRGGYGQLRHEKQTGLPENQIVRNAAERSETSMPVACGHRPRLFLPLLRSGGNRVGGRSAAPRAPSETEAATAEDGRSPIHCPPR